MLFDHEMVCLSTDSVWRLEIQTKDKRQLKQEKSLTSNKLTCFLKPQYFFNKLG
jgi:hypothetical protein